MDVLSALFVHEPANILYVAGAFFVAYAVLRHAPIGNGRDPRPLLVPGCAWSIYGLWELVVILRTPEANIRVDLLVIWPLLGGLSVWYTLKALRRVGPGVGKGTGRSTGRSRRGRDSELLRRRSSPGS